MHSNTFICLGIVSRIINDSFFIKRHSIPIFIDTISPQPSIRDLRGNTPLHVACFNGDLDCVQALTNPLSITEQRPFPHAKPIPYTTDDVNERNYDGKFGQFQLCVVYFARMLPVFVYVYFPNFVCAFYFGVVFCDFMAMFGWRLVYWIRRNMAGKCVVLFLACERTECQSTRIPGRVPLNVHTHIAHYEREFTTQHIERKHACAWVLCCDFRGGFSHREQPLYNEHTHTERNRRRDVQPYKR